MWRAIRNRPCFFFAWLSLVLLPRTSRNDEDDIIETYNDMIFMLQKAMHNEYLKNRIFYGLHPALDDIADKETKEGKLG